MNTRQVCAALLPLAIAAYLLASPASAQNGAFRNLSACKDGAFSTVEDFAMTRGEAFDGNRYISDGDLLSFHGQVCVRNADLMLPFGIKEDLGLDAVDILSFEPGLIAFSTKLDSTNGMFTAGDLLITNGVIIPNSALMLPFGIRHDVGLDELKFVGKIEDILRFVDAARGVKREAWGDGILQKMLKEFSIDIWFSIEGTKWDPRRPILDGDLLSASGNVVATNRELLSPGAPAGLQVDGVDFGLDAFAVARDVKHRRGEPLDIFFSTRILYRGKPGFTDGDVLRQGGGVVITNEALVTPFHPAANFLGLDALWMPTLSPPLDPHITTMCDLTVGEFNGGIAPIGGSGTGLHESALSSPPELTDKLERPCGAYVPVDGTLPVPPSTVNRFRVVYREFTEPVPGVIGDPTTPAIQTKWNLTKGKWKWIQFVGFQWVCELPAILSTDANGWMDASDYVDAKNGIGSYIGCPHPELRLAVWNTQALPPGTPAGDQIPGVRDREDHYVVWLEWEDSGVVKHRETVEHHVQLDNTLPVIAAYPNGLQLRLMDGTTVVPACGEAPAGASQFQVWAQFSDKYYYNFSLGLKGGQPPASVAYGPQYFYNPTDGTLGIKNTDSAGTVPHATTVHVRDISMTDLGTSFSKCCYLLEMYVSDRAIRHSFDGTFVNDFAGPDYSYAFITFSAQP